MLSREGSPGMGVLWASSCSKWVCQPERLVQDSFPGWTIFWAKFSKCHATMVTIGPIDPVKLHYMSSDISRKLCPLPFFPYLSSIVSACFQWWCASLPVLRFVFRGPFFVVDWVSVFQGVLGRTSFPIRLPFWVYKATFSTCLLFYSNYSRKRLLDERWRPLLYVWYRLLLAFRSKLHW